MSAQARPLFALSLLATASITYARFVAFDPAPSPLPGILGAKNVGTAGAKVHAVAGRSALLGEAFDGVIYGTAVVEAGAAVAQGAKVASDAAGRAITQTGTAETAGIAMQAATAAGELIEVLLVS